MCIYLVKQWTKISFFLILFACTLQAENKSQYVNLFIGTAGDNGQVDPAACLPYGMVRVCPDSNPRSHSGYDYDVQEISGFSVNRISGIGCSGAGGNIRVKPAAKGKKLQRIQSTEAAIPGYYTVSLNNQVKTEFTATHNTAVERFHYPAGEEAILTLDAGASFTKVLDAQYEIVSDRIIAGYIHAGNTCDHGAYKLYFHLQSNKPFTVVSQEERVAEISFGKVPVNEPVEIRIALSPIDKATAKKEYELAQHKTFEQIKETAAAEWEKILSKIDIKEASHDDKVLFYTCLYRIFLSPANVTAWDGRYLGTDGEIYSNGGFTHYGCWSMWDSYRTKFPMIALLDKPTMHDICHSLSKLFVNGKRDWATKFESTPTVRTEHTVTVLLDAYRKGITDMDLREAYPGIKKEMEGLRTERPDQALETCIDLWSAAGIAGILNEKEDAAYFTEKAQNLFLTTWESDFKNVDETFGRMRNSGLYQGTRWQYRWALPQYLDLMISTMNSKDELADQFEYFFDNSLNNQGNEAGLHAPFIGNRLGRPAKTQQVVRDILTKEMTHIYGGNAEYPSPIVDKVYKLHPEGFLYEADEDDGTMCAWYVFGAIGLFPLVIGEPWYEITSPLHDQITLQLDGGKTLSIVTKKRKTPEDIIKTVKFNGKKIKDYRIDHNQLVQGGVLEIIY